MSSSQKSRTAIRVVTEQLRALRELATSVAHCRDLSVVANKFVSWMVGAEELLTARVHPHEAMMLEQRGRGARDLSSWQEFSAICASCGAFLERLAKELAFDPDAVLAETAAEEEATDEGLSPPQPAPRPVFVIHGRDELYLRRLRELLDERWRLKPIVMRWEPGKGRTLIEKFEEEAQKAGFAFALMTPDDLVRVAEGDYAQARPNVAFELGWFYGRLGRSNVCILMKRGTQIHSDLDGISRIQFDESVEEKVLDIERELKAAKILKTE